MFLLAYLIFAVYCYSRKRSAKDFRVIIMLVSLFNSLFVVVNVFVLPFDLRVRTFFIYEILRFAILFCMCYMYSSIVTRDLLPTRNKVVRCLAVYFWVVVVYQCTVGYMLQLKLKQDYNYARLLCTDPLLPTLRIAPFTASVLFAIIILLIKLRVETGSRNYMMELDEARKEARLRTIGRLQYITAFFVINSFLLITWDLLRYLNNRALEPDKVNCFGMVENEAWNAVLIFLARFFTAQAEMYVVIINFWKRYKGPLSRQRQQDLEAIFRSRMQSHPMMSMAAESAQIDHNQFDFNNFSVLFKGSKDGVPSNSMVANLIDETSESTDDNQY